MLRPTRSRTAFLATLAALGAAHGSARAAVGSSWLNTGSDWFNSANWVGGVPTVGQGALLPASALPINPDVGIVPVISQSLTINNTLGAYSIVSPFDTTFKSPTSGTYVGTVTL